MHFQLINVPDLWVSVLHLNRLNCNSEHTKFSLQ